MLSKSYFPLVRPSKTCFIVLACRGFWKTRLIRVLWDVPKNPNSCGTASHGVGPGRFLHFGIPVPKADVLAGWKRRQQRFAPDCSHMCWDRWTLQCFRAKKFTLQSSLSRSDRFSSRDNTRAPKMSFALAMILTMNARRFQRTHTSSGMRSSLCTSKDTGMGNIYIAHICASESMMDAVRVTVVGSACAGLELDAGSGHKRQIFQCMLCWRHTMVFLNMCPFSIFV